MDAYDYLKQQYNIDDYYNSTIFRKKDGGYTSNFYVSALMNEYLSYSLENIIKDFVEYAKENNFPIRSNIEFTIQKYINEKRK